MHKMLSKLLVAVLLALAATPAAAQATTTWVSGAGNDANPCNRIQPCRTWAGALIKTAAGGVIIALDPGDYGRVTITKSITLSGGGVARVFPAAGLEAITIMAGAADRVVLRGLDIDGTGNGTVGVLIFSALDVLIADCSIHGFRGRSDSAGVHVNAWTTARVAIRNSTLHSNNFGMRVNPAGGTGHVKVDRSLVLDNSGGGLMVDGAGNEIEIEDNQIFGRQGLIQTNGGVVRSYGGNVIPSGTFPAQTAATK